MSLEAKIKRWIAGNKIRFDAPRRPREFNMQTRAEFIAQIEHYLGPIDWESTYIPPPPPPQLAQYLTQFRVQTPKHRPYLYPHHGRAFTGRAAKHVLDKIAGPDTDYLSAFLFQHRIVRKIGFGRVDRIIPDDTLYRIHTKTLNVKEREIQNGGLSNEVAYFQRRASELENSQS
uniref:VRR-NUC domain-containing protein n=1 Tax=Panagrellus redivivus TaxID=6233 RepID=A0A7E4V857_PANRE